MRAVFSSSMARRVNGRVGKFVLTWWRNGRVAKCLRRGAVGWYSFVSACGHVQSIEIRAITGVQAYVAYLGKEVAARLHLQPV